MCSSMSAAVTLRGERRACQITEWIRARSSERCMPCSSDIPVPAFDLVRVSCSDRVRHLLGLIVNLSLGQEYVCI